MNPEGRRIFGGGHRSATGGHGHASLSVPVPVVLRPAGGGARSLVRPATLCRRVVPVGGVIMGWMMVSVFPCSVHCPGGLQTCLAGHLPICLEGAEQNSHPLQGGEGQKEKEGDDPHID